MWLLPAMENRNNCLLSKLKDDIVHLPIGVVINTASQVIGFTLVSQVFARWTHLLVASSSKRMPFGCSMARARDSSCSWPTENVLRTGCAPKRPSSWILFKRHQESGVIYLLLLLSINIGISCNLKPIADHGRTQKVKIDRIIQTPYPGHTTIQGGNLSGLAALLARSGYPLVYSFKPSPASVENALWLA